MTRRMPAKLLFVCLGNICRSPAAEAVFLHLAEEAGVAGRFSVDSAGTGGWHVGDQADRRMRQAARARGIAVTSRARQVAAGDFDRFDHIFAMDAENLRTLRALAPPPQRHKLRLFRDLDPDAPGEDVPDPYGGGPDDFDEVLDIVTRTGRALLAELTAGHDA
jgi:protein-tyrosine phosphatase